MTPFLWMDALWLTAALWLCLLAGASRPVSRGVLGALWAAAAFAAAHIFVIQRRGAAGTPVSGGFLSAAAAVCLAAGLAAVLWRRGSVVAGVLAGSGIVWAVGRILPSRVSSAQSGFGSVLLWLLLALLGGAVLGLLGFFWEKGFWTLLTPLSGALHLTLALCLLLGGQTLETAALYLRLLPDKMRGRYAAVALALWGIGTVMLAVIGRRRERLQQMAEELQRRLDAEAEDTERGAEH